MEIYPEKALKQVIKCIELFHYLFYLRVFLEAVLNIHVLLSDTKVISYLAYFAPISITLPV